MNYADNAYPFRAGQHFLYYSAEPAGPAAVLDAETGTAILFGTS